MLRTSSIIEITSSPEPEVEARCSYTVSEPGSATESSFKVNSRRHAEAQRNAELSPARAKAPQKCMGPVIELTDSDDEEPAIPARRSIHASGSSMVVIELDDSDADEPVQLRRRAQAQSTPRANAVASGSGLATNVRAPKKRARETSPIGERPQKRVLRTLGGDVTQVRGTDTGDDGGVQTELEGYDPNFADKPFPFDFLGQRALGGVVAPPSRPPSRPLAGPSQRTSIQTFTPSHSAANNGMETTLAPPHLPPADHPPWVAHALQYFRANRNPPKDDYMRPDPVISLPAAASNDPNVATPVRAAPPSPAPPLARLSPRTRTADDLASTVTAQILDVVPDIHRGYLARLVAAQLPEHGEDTSAHVLAELFDSGTWPREVGDKIKPGAQREGRVGATGSNPARSFAGSQNKGKRPASEVNNDTNDEARGAKRARFETAVVDHPRPKITSHDSHTGEAIEEQITSKDKGKGRALPEPDDSPGIECQCCFGEYPFDKMVQCPEAHLFCSPCVEAYSSTQLGLQRSALLCMHASGCARPFPAAQLERALPPASFALWERLTQADEIAQAGLTGLTECPFCDWKCVLEEDNEGEGEGGAGRFWCGNRDKCGVISCRKCKKSDHHPKTCEEAEADKHLDGRHTIEEAMTAALMRNCPKCKKAFIKDEGCNKMTCPTCRTLSCYVCRAVITGYEHFDQTPRGHASTSRATTGKCRLWDNVEERHVDEVRAAAAEATAAYKRTHPDANDAEIAVDVPVAAPPGARSTRGGMFPRLGGILGRAFAPLPAMPLLPADPLHDVFPVLRAFQQPMPMGFMPNAAMWRPGPPPPPQPRHVQPLGNPFDIGLGVHAGLLPRGEYGFNPFAAAPAPEPAPPAPAPVPPIERRRQIRLPLRAMPEVVAEVGVPPFLRLPQARRNMRPGLEFQAAELQAPALLGRPQTRRIIRPDPPAAIVAGRAGAGIGARAGASGQRAM